MCRPWNEPIAVVERTLRSAWMESRRKSTGRTWREISRVGHIAAEFERLANVLLRRGCGNPALITYPQGGSELAVLPLMSQSEPPAVYLGKGNDHPSGQRYVKGLEQLITAADVDVTAIYDRAVQIEQPGGSIGKTSWVFRNADNLHYVKRLEGHGNLSRSGHHRVIGTPSCASGPGSR
jgi:hypothetical protein